MAPAFPQKPGLYFLGQTQAWDLSFQWAQQILQKSSRAFLSAEKPTLVLLGPHIGEASREWLLAQQLSADKQLFGNIFLPWRDWVRERVRQSQHTQGQALRELSPLKARKILRQCLEALERAEKLPGVGKLWREERFFRTILAEILELREAGLDQETELLRARELLQQNQKESRFDLEELWYLLKIFSDSLLEERVLDWAALLRQAAESSAQEPLYLLGFSFFSPLERELLQTLAKQVPVVVVLTGAATAKHPLVQSLSLGYAEFLEFLGDRESEDFSGFPVLVGHTPTEELIACGSFLASRLGSARVALSRELESCWPHFAAAYGEPNLRSVGSEPEAVLPKLLQALSLVEQDFALDALSDYSVFLASYKDANLASSGARLSRLGFRKGLYVLQNLAKTDAILQKLFLECQALQAAFPKQATGRQFEWALGKFLKEVGWAESARLESAEGQRFFHGALAALTKAAAQVAAENQEELTRTDWLADLRFLSESYQAEVRGAAHSDLSVYKHGEWLAPAQANSCTVLLGLSQGANPSPERKFYLDERTRLRLQDWGLETQQALDAHWLCYLQAAGGSKGLAIASWSRHSETGETQSAAWALDLYGWEAKAWPESIWPYATEAASVEERQFQIPPPSLETASVTLLNAWGDCGFKAWAEQLVRLQDDWLESDLDLPAMDQGSVFHRTVELYFSQFSGRELIDDEAIAQAARSAAELAFQEQSWRYYKGGQGLLEIHKEQLLRSLLQLLQQQRDYFLQFPQLGTPLCEQEFSLQLPGAKLGLKGKIDRIDLSRDGAQLLVVDYKTGASAPESKEVVENQNLQLQLYLNYASKKYKAQPAAGYFLLLKDPSKKRGIFREEFRTKKERTTPMYFEVGPTNKGLLKEEQWQAVLCGAEAEAVRRLEKIAAGEFWARPHKEELCERCSVRPACRIHADDSVSLGATPQTDYAVWEQELKSLQPNLKQASTKSPTPEQAAAIGARGKLVFVEASAGTGKTTVLVERIAQEIAELVTKIPLEETLDRILAISFTDKSTQELSERLAKRLLPDYGPLFAAQASHGASTIHGFCSQVILDFPALAGVSPLVRSLNALEAKELQEEVLEDLFIAPSLAAKTILTELYKTYSRRHLHKALLDLCGKRSLLEQENIETWEPVAALLFTLSQEFFALYDEKKAALSVLDFNDQERLCLKVLRQKASYYRQRFSLVLVDEFQDTNSVQRQIVEWVARPALSNLFVVGDAKQSIYRFRAADVAVFQGLRKEAEAMDSLYSLSTNFRSQARVVNFVNELCAKEMPMSGAAKVGYEAEFSAANAFHPPKAAVQLLQVEGDKQLEAKILAQEIATQIREGRSAGDIAILLRKLTRNDAYANELRNLEIPFVQEGGEDYFSENVVMDGISLLRVLVAVGSNLSLVALLRSPWFRVKAETLHALALMARTQKKSLFELIQGQTAFALLFTWKDSLRFRPLSMILRQAYQAHPQLSDPQLRAQALKLVAKLQELESRGLGPHELVRCLSRWAGYESKVEGTKERLVPAAVTNCVTLSTVHAAKGLEYPITYLVDLDGRSAPDSGPIRYYPGIALICKDPQDEEDPPAFAHAVSENKARELAESKRLLYVALTRAQEDLRILLMVKEKESKTISWGAWLRALAPSDNFLRKKMEWQNLTALAKTQNANTVLKSKSLAMGVRVYPFSTTVSELSAYRFCPEFHRRKFILSWEDKVTDLFPTAFQTSTKADKAIRSPADKALRSLGLQKKERGIALHRALERTHADSHKEEWALWLREIYASQGAASGEALESLIAADIELLRVFLQSAAGQLLFGQGVQAFAELPFHLQLAGIPVVGAIDRVARTKTGHWIIADYKSSLGEASLPRYTLQVATYMLALQQALVFAGETQVQLTGLLIDIHLPVWLELPFGVLPERELQEILQNLQLAYTEVGKSNPHGGKHCALCPYVPHCDVGQKSVLQF